MGAGKILGPVDKSTRRTTRDGVSRFGGQTETQDSRRYALNVSPSGMVGSEALFHSPCRICSALNRLLGAVFALLWAAGTYGFALVIMSVRSVRATAACLSELTGNARNRTVVRGGLQRCEHREPKRCNG